jgi:hypothetical protein
MRRAVPTSLLHLSGKMNPGLDCAVKFSLDFLTLAGNIRAGLAVA